MTLVDDEVWTLAYFQQVRHQTFKYFGGFFFTFAFALLSNRA